MGMALLSLNLAYHGQCFKFTNRDDLELFLGAVCGMPEDDNMTVDRNVFHNYSLMNKLALSLTRLASSILKKSVRSTRKITGWDIDRMVKFSVLLTRIY